MDSGEPVRGGGSRCLRDRADCRLLVPKAAADVLLDVRAAAIAARVRHAAQCVGLELTALQARPRLKSLFVPVWVMGPSGASFCQPLATLGGSGRLQWSSQVLLSAWPNSSQNGFRRVQVEEPKGAEQIMLRSLHSESHSGCPLSGPNLLHELNGTEAVPGCGAAVCRRCCVRLGSAASQIWRRRCLRGNSAVALFAAALC